TGLADADQLAGPLRAEHAVRNRRSGTAERNISHREVRLLDRQREGGPGLIAVERAVARGAEPAGAVLAPVAFRLRGRGVAGLVAAIPGAARAEIIAAAAGEKAPEAEPVIGKDDRPIRIAF